MLTAAWMLLSIVGPDAAARELDTIGFDDGEFVLERDGSTVTVHAVRVPAPVQAEPAEPSCPVVFGWAEGEVTHRVRDCPGRLQEGSLEAARQWELSVDEPHDGDLFEVWFRYDTDPYEPPEVYVRRAYDVSLTLNSPRVHTLPYTVRQRAFVDYPEAAYGVDTTDRRCRALVPIAPTGLPRAITVERCDEVFHEAVISGLKRYRFATVTIGGSPASSALTIGVHFNMELDDSGEIAGKVEVDLPDPVQGAEDRLTEAPRERPVPTRPSWDPHVVLDHGPYAEVGVYGWEFPELEPVAYERECSLLFQVNAAREVDVWPEDCDSDLAPQVVKVAQRWNLMTGEIKRQERYARFRGDVVLPAEGGEPYLRVPEDDLVSTTREGKQIVRTYRRAEATKRVPPKLPRSFEGDVSGGTECVVRMRINKGGRGEDFEVAQCAEALHPYAVKALKRWRWDPAEQEGKRISTRATIKVKFSVPG